jgi:hypothetical protein
MTGDDDGEDIDMHPLLRIGAWGFCAVLALGAAVFAGRSETGERRAAAALAALTSPADPTAGAPGQPAKPLQPDPETQRLTEAVRTLTEDRDRLTERVAALEHSLNDLTSSISRASPAPAPRMDEPPQTPAPPASSAEDKPEAAAVASPPPAAETAPAEMSSNVPLPRPAPLAMIQSYVEATPYTPSPPSVPQTRIATAPVRPAAAPVAPKGDFAVDLAIATNVNTLRTRWDALRTRYAAQLEGLDALVSVRDSPKPGESELHLVAGPLPDAVAVSRLCAALLGAGVRCQPSVFDGQRLTSR